MRILSRESACSRYIQKVTSTIMITSWAVFRQTQVGTFKVSAGFRAETARPR
jgi:hypothetical protein